MAVSTPHGINVHKLDKPCLDGLSTWCTPSLLLMRNYSSAIVGRRQWVGRVRWLGCRTGGPTRAGLPALLTQFPGSIVSAKVMTWRTHSCVPRRRYIPGTYYTQDTGDIVNKDGAVCLPQCPGKNTV